MGVLGLTISRPPTSLRDRSDIRALVQGVPAYLLAETVILPYQYQYYRRQK